MGLSNLDLIHPTTAKAFWFAARTLNFSTAAKEANFTQPGISKHIAKLEGELGTTLFYRTKPQLKLTPAGTTLLGFLQEYYSAHEEMKRKLTDINKEPVGVVKYAMPESCLMSPHFSLLLAKKRALFPKIDLHVSIAENSRIEMMIESLEVDFGFMTAPSSFLESKSFCQEEYVLVGHRSFKEISVKNIDSLPFLHYPGFDRAFKTWEKAKRIQIPIKIKGRVSEQRGIISMLEAKEGVTVMARHCLLHQLQIGKLIELRAAGKPATNEIFMVQMNNIRQTMAVQTVQNSFYDILEEK